MTDRLSWRVLSTDAPEDYAVFRVARRTSQHPQSGAARRFSIIQAPDWINIIALTAAGEIILVRQFRHGRDHVTLEIPAGMVDPGEAPLNAAQRELREETGYTAPRWHTLGVVEPNPAIMNNRCVIYLALGAALTHPVDFDPDELIEVELRPLATIREALLDGEINSALMVAAFLLYRERIGGWRAPALNEALSLASADPAPASPDPNA
ncbi:NUDIX hydrolase [Myxococcota bacterium]|nr:NUDIX hydrolase [Myxococcota bacterium]MBU1896768.1 NUDIX hydrolase [Myxococcota bacterium]